MSWRWRTALAIALGAATTVAVCWLASLFPFARWLSIEAPAPAGNVDLGVWSDGRRWMAWGDATASPLGSDIDIGLFHMPADSRLPSNPKSLAPYVEPDLLLEMPRVLGQRLAVHRFGWPLRALEWRESAAGGPLTFPPTTGPKTGVFQLPPALIPPGSSGVVPLIPRWTGLMVDTLVFSLIWLAFLTLPRFGRVFEWWFKRRCAVCGYDRRGLPPAAVCPECGVLPTSPRKGTPA